MPSKDNTLQAIQKLTPIEKAEVMRSHRIAINCAMASIMEERRAIKLVAHMTQKGESRSVLREAESSLLEAAFELAAQLETVHGISA